MNVSDTRAVARGVRSLALALLPPEAGGPPADDVVRAVGILLDRMPAVAAAGVGGAGLALEAAALVRHRRPLADLDPDTRSGMLAALGRAGAPGTVALDAVKALLLLAAGGDGHAGEIAATARAAAPARTDGELDLADAETLPPVLRADVVVVGSGAGGAFAARELARAGRSVIVVDEGRRWPVEELRAGHPVARFARLYRDGGATFAAGMPPIALPIGRAVGGTTVVNSGTCYRPPAPVRADWHERHGLALAAPERLEPRLADVEATIGVAPAPMDVLGRNGRLALQGAAALGWQAAPLRRNAPGCRGACQCALGCPNNAKAGVHLTALPQACAAGTRIVQRLRVRRVLERNGVATGIEGTDAAGRTVRIDAALVIVAAGATETPPLLRRSGLGGHPRLGRGLSVHPALGVSGTFEEPVLAWRGVLQSVGVEELHAREGILIEATATPPGMGSMVLPGVGRDLLGRIAGAEHVANLGGMVADAPVGRVIGRRAPVVVYPLAREDARRLIRAAGAMAEILFAAGAREVELGGGAPTVRGGGELAGALARMDPRRLHLAAFHPSGTAAGGADPARHPCDPHGKLRGVRGVTVADASLLPACPGVNPQVSIMALASEAAAAAL